MERLGMWASLSRAAILRNMGGYLRNARYRDFITRDGTDYTEFHMVVAAHWFTDEDIVGELARRALGIYLDE